LAFFDLEKLKIKNSERGEQKKKKNKQTNEKTKKKTKTTHAVGRRRRGCIGCGERNRPACGEVSADDFPGDFGVAATSGPAITLYRSTRCATRESGDCAFSLPRCRIDIFGIFFIKKSHKDLGGCLGGGRVSTIRTPQGEWPLLNH
jgi:hypothetical protein